MDDRKLDALAQTRRRDGPVRARRRTVDLPAPPRADEQVRSAHVLFEQLSSGRMRFTLPGLPGWVAVASTPAQVVTALAAALVEVEIAQYSTRHGATYGHPFQDTPPGPRRPISLGGQRADTYHPQMWRLDTDGRWVSPRGLKYAEDTQVVGRVMKRRAEMGLPPRPDATDWIPTDGPPIVRHMPLTPTLRA